MAFPIPKKRAPETDTFYERRYAQLREQAGRKLGNQKGAYVAPIHVVNYLLSRRKEIAKRTWQVYKSICVAQMEAFASSSDDPVLKQEYRHAAGVLQVETQSEALKRGSQTSALKIKRIPEADHLRLMEYLASRIGVDKWAAISKTLCEATLLTGLRPSEWERATLIVIPREGLALAIWNAKSTQGRANGAIRRLLLSDLSDERISLISDMVEIGRHYADCEEGWQNIQGKISDYLYSAGKKVFPRRSITPCLYSYRHQFAANNKGRWSKAEVAALMGHGSDETAGRNYARASRDAPTGGVRPLESEVARVRHVSRDRPKPIP